MSKGKLQEAIKVMQAFADGKEIQYYQEECSPRWQSTLFPVWNWQEVNYRIKPEPRVLYILLNHDGTRWGSTFIKGEAEEWAKCQRGHDGIIRKFMEVIED